MKRFSAFIKKYWWPISAILFCPCHLPLSMGGLLALTAGTGIGALFAAYYSTIESVLAVTFSFYFVIAFLIWIVRAPRKEANCPVDTRRSGQPQGLSTKQIVSWGTGSALLMPMLILAAFVTREGTLDKIIAGARDFDYANSGFIWLVSISAIVMIPVMVVWIVWMWIMWRRPDAASKPEKQGYEYDYE